MTKPNKAPLRKALLLLVSFAFFTITIQAQPKIGLIDLKRAFEDYWKTKQADTNLKDRAADFEKSRKSMVEDYQKANEDYRQLIEKANDQAVSSEERDNRKKLA